jgi:hypothetical protein
VGGRDAHRSGDRHRHHPARHGLEERPYSSKAIIDACRPYDHLHDFPEVAEASKELQEKTRKKWKDLFS